MNKLKLSPERITKAPKDFISRFLDIPLEELCGYTKEQIEGMIESTIEQMPDEMLRQFEIELADGMREL